MSLALLLELPDTLLGAILGHLSLLDGQKVCTTCKGLHRRREALRQLRQFVCVQSQPEVLILHHVYLPHKSLTNLCRLDLGSYGTNDILQQLGTEDALPRLQSLSMVDSWPVTDEGLTALSHARACAETLQYIDITFCYNTSYAGTFCLRDNFSCLRVLRRLPEWMTGCFETPFENDGLHTYYADGSFEFEREQQSTGYVMQLNQWYQTNPHLVFNKLQYSNFQMPDPWPDWVRYVYRPGVSLFRLDDQEVLVGQVLKGLQPPRDVPRREHLQFLPECKASVYLDRQGRLVEENAIGDNTNHEPRERAYYLVSRMRVYPLPSLMPPSELVEKNRAFCQQLEDSRTGHHGDTEAAREDALHHHLGGEEEYRTILDHPRLT